MEYSTNNEVLNVINHILNDEGDCIMFQSNDIPDEINQMDHIQSSQIHVLSTSNSDHELQILLKSWNQEHLLDTLTYEKIDVNILKIIKQHHIKNVLKDFKLGDQILFEHNLELWRKDIGLPLYVNEPMENNSISPAVSKEFQDQRLQRCSPYLVSSPSSSRTSSPEPSSTKYVTLASILNDTRKGQMISEYYERNKKLKDEHRIALINLVASYFEDNDYHLSLKTSYRMEKEILDHFPNEMAELYRTGKRGKIYTRYCNAKRNLKSLTLLKGQKEKDDSSQEKTKFCPEVDAELAIRSIRYDNLSTQDFDSVWQSCRNYRLNEVHKLACLKDILNKWPEYKKSCGFRLIDMDFKGMHPDSSSILDKWETESPKIKKFLQERVRDKAILINLSKLEDAAYNEDYYVLELLRSIHGFLIPTQRVARTDSVGKKSLHKPTIRDSQNAFVYVGESVQQVEDHIEFLTNRSENIQPLILVVGNLQEKKIDQIILLIDGVKLIFNSMLRATDICFKSFFVFNINYPIECEQFWTFFEKFFYKADMTCNQKSSKVVHMIETVNGSL